jgi:hypothetical protein
VSAEKRSNAVQGVYSALIGGLMAAFGAVVVFTWFVDANARVVAGSVPIAAVLIGLGSAVAYMVAGMALSNRVPWLSGGFLFASGFSVLWSSVLSINMEQRWVAVVALGAAIVLGIGLGWWRFGRPGAGPDRTPGD